MHSSFALYRVERNAKMSKWQIFRHVDPSQSRASWFIVIALAVCFAFANPASAQLAEPIQQAMRSVLMPATATSPFLQSTRPWDVTPCTNSGDGTLEAVSFRHLAGDPTCKHVSWGGKTDDFTYDEVALPDISVGVSTANAEPSSTSSVVPGTIAKSSAMPLKPSHKSALRVEADSLPSWVSNQPLAYLRYGAAPAVVTLHFGHK